MNKIVHKAAQELGEVIQQHLSKEELNHGNLWLDISKKLKKNGLNIIFSLEIICFLGNSMKRKLIFI